MGFDFDNDLPIYLQIIEHIKAMIVSGEYKKGEKIPSVRELSLFFEVNPNTIQKSLAELENIGLIRTDRTNGKFVTECDDIIQESKMKTIDDVINEFFEKMEKLGFDRHQTMKILNDKE